ncbi:hypothetical protein LY76DRAFT_587277 [Colletotrichum caudatum]|nr:hypothetical protein LY76DRAFT_587277 [Colletotrichum caudatum]
MSGSVAKESWKVRLGVSEADPPTIFFFFYTWFLSFVLVIDGGWQPGTFLVQGSARVALEVLSILDPLVQNRCALTRVLERNQVSVLSGNEVMSRHP